MCNSECLLVILSLLYETSQDQLPIFDACLRVTWIPLVRATWRWANENATKKKKVLAVGIFPYCGQGNWTLFCCVLLHGIIFFNCNYRWVGNSQISLSRNHVACGYVNNAKAENLALQGRVNELQECNALICSTNERISAQVTEHFTEKEDLQRKIS